MSNLEYFAPDYFDRDGVDVSVYEDNSFESTDDGGEYAIAYALGACCLFVAALIVGAYFW